MADQAPPATDGEPAGAGLLAKYLADNDAPCPACRYNLRGCTGSVCPECGSPINLGIAGRPRHWVPPLLALLVFGWVVVAGGLNTARNGRLVYEAARPRQAMLITQLQLRTTISLRLNGQGVVTQSGPLNLTPPAPVATPVGGMSWSSVPWELWGRLAWSVFLVGGGAAGVVLVLRHRRRPLSERAWKITGVHALVLFAVYGGYHVYLFTGEVMNW